MQGRQPTPRVEEPLGESPAVRALRSEIAAVAPLSSTVLVTGETGVGKGVVARELHRCSRRRGPFVHVDCAALAPGLIESELFGHERGAFTGAVAARPGHLERAAAGTLFLDEIGELEPALQAVLLRVLQDREFERIGGGRTQPMRARVIAATSRELRRDVPGGRFRADLYFRLAVVRLALPPLRARRGDIPLLARTFLDELARHLELPAPVLGSDFVERLVAHDWPGNVRELHNALERALIRSVGRRLEAADLSELDEPLWTASAGVAEAALPAERIAAALRRSGGNVARAARQLGLPRTTLRRRMRLYGLEPP
jgi:DNA-binding NtrC family response regulator